MSHPSHPTFLDDPPEHAEGMGLPLPTLVFGEITGVLPHFGFDAGDGGGSMA